MLLHRKALRSPRRTRRATASGGCNIVDRLLIVEERENPESITGEHNTMIPLGRELKHEVSFYFRHTTWDNNSQRNVIGSVFTVFIIA